MSNREEFDLLVEKRLAGRVTPEEQAQLKSILAQDPALRAEFLIAVSQEAALKAIHRKSSEPAELSTSQPPPRPRLVRETSNTWMAPLGVCALLAVSVLLYFVFRSNPTASPPSVAKLKDTSGGTSVVRGGASVPLSNPLEILPNDEIRCPQNSSARIEYGDAQVSLKPDTLVWVDPTGKTSGGKCIQIKYGKLSAIVGKQPPGHPMLFVSEQAVATVLGTQLELEVAIESKSTKLSVIEGNVRFASVAESKAIEVAGGESAVAGNGAVFAVIQNAAPAVNSGRVRDGLQALYTFKEQNGETIKDVSETGAAMNLTISDAAGVSWLKNGGLDVHGVVKISTAENAGKVLRASRNSGAITIEAWIKRARIEPNTLRYILTLHGGPGVHLMEIAQHGDEHHSTWQFNLEAAPNAHHHAAMVDGPRAPVADGLAHVVFTRDAAGNAKAYVNGVEQARAQMAGELSTWDEHHFFTLGGDGTSRIWNGEFHLVAIYDRALAAADVKKNFDAGAQ